MSEHLDAAQAWAREAHDRLAEATATHAAELERIRGETQARIAIAEEDRDSAIERAEADKAEGIAAAERRASRAEAQAQEAIAQARAEALVRAANDARDQALAQAAQADQRAATAEARAEDARAETARIREDAARELAQLRADAGRERDEILARLTDTAKRLSEVTTGTRRRARAGPGRRSPRAGRTARRAGMPRPGARGITRRAARPGRAR